MATPNLGIAHIAANQTQKEVTANNAFDALDTAMTDTFAFDVSAGGTLTPTAASVIAAFTLKFTGTITGNVTVNVPNNKKSYRIHHAATGAYTVTVKVSGQTGIVLNPGDIRLVYCNGTDVVQGDSYAAGAEQKANRNGTYPTWVAVPPTAGSTGTAGQMAYGGGYLYVCIAANTWVRAAIATF